jgi:hypothetical protein
MTRLTNRLECAVDLARLPPLKWNGVRDPST